MHSTDIKKIPEDSDKKLEIHPEGIAVLPTEKQLQLITFEMDTSCTLR